MGLAVVGEQQRAQRLARVTRVLEVVAGDGRGRLEQAARVEPVAQPGDVVEQVRPVLAVDGVDQRLHQREPPGSRLAAAWVDRRAQQGFTLHRLSVTMGIANPVPAS